MGMRELKSRLLHHSKDAGKRETENIFIALLSTEIRKTDDTHQLVEHAAKSAQSPFRSIQGADVQLSKDQIILVP